MKPGSKQKDLDNIIKEKVENEKLKEEIETLEDKLRNKVNDYIEAFDWQKRRKEGQLSYCYFF